ncbi:MAG: hypothetical protein QW409_02185 [Candidatus Aenigmatarchaeota archaeon]
MKEKKQKSDCCNTQKSSKSSCCEIGGKQTEQTRNQGIFSGIIYGLVPHSVCILFIIFSIFGATFATSLLKPLLLNEYFFYILIALSIIFATISAILYFKRQGVIKFQKSKDGIEIEFSWNDIKNRWKYLTTLYASTIGTNVLFFLIIFPLLANYQSNLVSAQLSENFETITLKVDIPCSGHSPLVIDELKKVDGIISVKFRFPNYFDVTYDKTKISKDQILSLEIFKNFKATLISEGSNQQSSQSLGYSSKTQSCGCNRGNLNI